MDRRSEDNEGLAVVAQVAHELRSPLTSIRGYTSLLRNRWEKISDDDKQLMIDQIHHDAERVTRLINELLDISRIESNQLTLGYQVTDLAALAAQVVQSTATNLGITVRLDFPGEGLSAVVDADKVEQVLNNLLENAAKYGDPDTISITGVATELAGSPAVRVTVADQGPGVSADDAERIFEKGFHREYGRPTGTGLGLWISRSLVEAHHGRLTLDSTVGHGSAFSFVLPTLSPEKRDVRG